MAVSPAGWWSRVTERFRGGATPVREPQAPIDGLPYFRSLSFFACCGDLTDAQCLTSLRARLDTAPPDGHFLADWHALHTPTADLADLRLLSWDRDRVWWRDTEADVCAENRVYTRTLDEWSRIARGAFTPTGVEETWATATGPVSVTFTLGDARHELRPKYVDAALDLAVLAQLNRLIAPSGYQFEQHLPFDQTAFVVALTADEKAHLRRDRGWRFST